jgi:hypothetical protein
MEMVRKVFGGYRLIVPPARAAETVNVVVGKALFRMIIADNSTISRTNSYYLF